jgi:hypothetical protein
MDTVQDRLYAKLSAEYGAFIDGLKAKAPDAIIDSSYEKVYKEEILMNLESGSIGDEEAVALLALDNPLDELYSNWLHTDVSVAEDIRDSILGSAWQEIERQRLPETAPTKESPAQAINGTVDVDNWIIPVTEKAYAGLIGQVIAIDKIGTEAHETENPGDDVHVDFTRVVYSGSEISAIEANFAELRGEHKPFCELPLDDVIMAPEMLVSLVGRDIEPVNEFMASCKEARAYANEKLNTQFAEFDDELMERIEDNYIEYNKSLLGFGKQELIEMAAAIHAHSDAWSYMTEDHSYSDAELLFYLKFENPLEIVADAWRERNIDVGDLEFTMDSIMEPERQKSALESYPLFADKPLVAEPVPKAAKHPEKQSPAIQPEKPKPAQIKPAQPPVKPEPPRKQSILAELDASIIEAQERNAARTPQAHKKSNQKEID